MCERVSEQICDHAAVKTTVSGPSHLDCKGCWDRENAILLTLDHKVPRGTMWRHKVPQHITKYHELLVFHEINENSSLFWFQCFILTCFVLSFSQFLSHPVVYNLLNSRWYRSFASVRKEPWTSPSRWGYFFLNL